MCIVLIYLCCVLLRWREVREKESGRGRERERERERDSVSLVFSKLLC